MTSGRCYFTGSHPHPTILRDPWHTVLTVVHPLLLPLSPPTDARACGAGWKRRFPAPWEGISDNSQPRRLSSPTAASRIFTSPQRCRSDTFPAFLGSAVPSQDPSVHCSPGFLMLVVLATAAPDILLSPQVGFTGRLIL